MAVADPGSFHDPASQVLVADDHVLRVLDARGDAAWKSISESTFFQNAVDRGQIIQTNEAEPLDDGRTVLRHPLLPFISYPYEWTFGMLKDAALLQLDLLDKALSDGVTIKDATPYNIQFVDGKPVFIDVGSFEPYRDGEPWIGYRQFTRQFLFPLMIQAWSGIPIQDVLRSNLDGPTAAQAVAMLPKSKRSRPAVAMHVGLQAKMEDRHRGRNTRDDLKSAGFSPELIKANVARLEKLIRSLDWDPGTTTWNEYTDCDHVDRDRPAKTTFLEEALALHQPDQVVDFGANDCHFSEEASNHAKTVIAVDGDQAVLNQAYQRGSTISLVVTDLANPSPAQGWAHQERRSLTDRINPDLVVAYGLIHHLIYTTSIPPRHVVSWLKSFSCPVVVEFVAPTDPMVKRLSANKTNDELHPDRSLEDFERLIISADYRIQSRKDLGDGDRTLFHIIPN